MNILEPVTFLWWQLAILKIGLIGIGILIGSYAPALFKRWRTIILILCGVSVIYIFWIWRAQDTDAPYPPVDGVACTADAKMCPDGSYVGRVGPRCEFAPCPSARGR